MNLMKRSLLFAVLLFFISIMPISAEEQRIYDEANLLSDTEIQELEKQAAAYFEEWQTDFIIITTPSTDGQDIMRYMQDFTDALEEDFKRSEDNMAVLTMAMDKRDIYLAGFGIAEDYLDDNRLNQILTQITPSLSSGEYFDAFEHFFVKSDEYLNIRPGVNPESILFNNFVQLGAAVLLAVVIVFIMAFNSGGRVTTNARTYLDQQNTRIISQRDRFIRKTLTKRKKPSDDNKSGGGGFGGGGRTSAGRSHSGSRGKF